MRTHVDILANSKIEGVIVEMLPRFSSPRWGDMFGAFTSRFRGGRRGMAIPLPRGGTVLVPVGAAGSSVLRNLAFGRWKASNSHILIYEVDSRSWYYFGA